MRTKQWPERRNCATLTAVHVLLELAHARMPFGRYKDRYLTDLPEAYLVWFRQRGFPEGPLGQMLESMYEIKVNGLERMVAQLRERNQRPC